MKINAGNKSMKVCISKDEWVTMGKQAGWLDNLFGKQPATEQKTTPAAAPRNDMTPLSSGKDAYGTDLKTGRYRLRDLGSGQYIVGSIEKDEHGNKSLNISRTVTREDEATRFPNDTLKSLVSSPDATRVVAIPEYMDDPYAKNFYASNKKDMVR